MSEELDVIYQIGIFVRRVLHRIRRDHPRVIHENLCGGCAIGSYLFDIVAQHSGMGCEMAYGSVYDTTHVWCVLGNRRTVVDVTMTQFGNYPVVYVAEADVAPHEPKTYGKAALARANRWGLSEKPERYQAPRLHYPRLHRAMERLCGPLTAPLP